MDINKLLKENTLSEKIQYILLYVLLFFSGYLIKGFPFLNTLEAVADKLSKQDLLLLSIFLILLALTLATHSYILSRKIVQLKQNPVFICRYGLNWKRTGKTIDPNPYCLCCNPPKPLRFHHQFDKDSPCEVLECVYSSKSNYEKLHHAQENNVPISYKEAYEKIKLSINSKSDI